MTISLPALKTILLRYIIIEKKLQEDLQEFVDSVWEEATGGWAEADVAEATRRYGIRDQLVEAEQRLREPPPPGPTSSASASTEHHAFVQFRCANREKKRKHN